MPSRNSIGDATAKSFSRVKSLLKERGIVVEAVDGPSQDDKELRFLQELQQVERALEGSAEKSAPAESSSVGGVSEAIDSADGFNVAPYASKKAR